MKKLSQKITFLNQSALECLNEPSEHKIFEKLTKAGIKVLGGNYGFVWQKKTSSKKFELVYKSPLTPYSPKPPRDKGSSNRVIETKNPLLIKDLPNEQDIRKDAKPYMKSLAVIPIFYKNKVYGSIFICFKKTKKFTADDPTLCSFIGNSAAQAITIYRLHNHLKRERENLEARVKQRTQQLQKSNWELAKSRAEDKAVFSSMGEGIIATTKEGKIILANPQAEAILGVKKNQILNQNLFEIQTLWDGENKEVPLHHRPTFLAMSRKHRIHCNDLCIMQNGQLKPISITANPIILKNKVIGAIQIIRDISQEKEIDKAKSELISLASHQLRTPLSAINWYAEALLSGELGRLNPQQKKYLKHIFGANQKMIELVYDFLNVSRIELGTFSLKLSELNLEEISDGVIKELEPEILRKNLRLEKKLHKGEEEITADRKILRIILQNLLSNAVKYTPTNGHIKLSTNYTPAERKPELVIEVTDTGYGIPANQQDKIFTKLFRADNIAKLNTEGSGLGLYIVKSLVDFCKGRVQFKSLENKGSTFKVNLPMETFNPVVEPIKTN